MSHAVTIFSDLDGCLLNKHDYKFEAAVPVLERIKRNNLPLVLASSKTVSEMRLIASDMHLSDAALICENGGAVFWGHSPDADSSILGVPRDQILEVLTELKDEFEFASFRDLGLTGVMQSTSLPQDRAELAMQRSSTEPLLWHDVDDKLDSFSQTLDSKGLCLTRGGRFWHVSGSTTKGAGMNCVLSGLSKENKPTTLAIGDSPIDQSMLDLADYPIGIPAPDGVVHITVRSDNGRIAEAAGAEGWAACVSEVLDKLHVGK